jgi:hypothetical protein
MTWPRSHATRLVAPDPSAVSQPSSQPPPSRCCDDLLNPRPTSEVSIVSKDETRSLGFGKPQGE